MTGLPAQWLGLKDRGMIAKNYCADLVVFDAKNISDLATYENPFKYPSGIQQVIINGAVALEKGEYKEILAGRVIRKS